MVSPKNTCLSSGRAIRSKILLLLRAGKVVVEVCGKEVKEKGGTGQFGGSLIEIPWFSGLCRRDSFVSCHCFCKGLLSVCSV